MPESTPTVRPERPVLVVVTPVYNESAVLPRYVDEVTRVLLSRPDITVRVLLVDDGSSDGSWSVIDETVRRSNQFAAIRLSRNFGPHTALAAGFDHVGQDADVVATLACDLQDPPETILAFVEEWRAGADIVWGRRRVRAEPRWRQVVSRSLETLLMRFAMPAGSKLQTGSFLLMDALVLDCVRRFKEQGRVTYALVAWTGFNQSVVAYDRKPRLGGRSGWSFGQMVNAVYDVFIGFSPVPAKLLTAFGFTMLLGSLVTVVYLLTTWLVRDVQPGWTGLMATMTLCFGFLFVMLGVSFEYLYRIFIETKDRPLYFIAHRSGDARPRRAPGE
jgi:dolichol-phosphate mannosyltransferase